ncbi:RNA-binding protein Musashi homolog 2 [Hyalella azteca]|uniref:RNA-binding protein Musashi homolog 2 n=1 Tax=Hyalella azteca TaxID=294128 RepID=A0A979FJ68_HYAAZ|nr:RNA-binding protein Musashi homolog 2 [Hyalella azteca]
MYSQGYNLNTSLMANNQMNVGPEFYGSGLLVKADSAALMATPPGGHKVEDHQSAVAIPGHHPPPPQQLVNGSSAVSQAGSSGRSSPAERSSPPTLYLPFPPPRSRGFGFITFGDPSSVEKVIAVPNHCLDGKKIDPKHATPKNRGRSNRTKKIFVGGVSQETSAEEVKQFFSQYGKVEEAVMLMDNQTKRHRGFGFVTFECEDVVERVCDLHFHNIKNKKVECKKAQPKEAVQAASLLTKRLMLPQPTLAVGMGSMGATAMLSAQQAAVLASAQAAALSSYGKLLGGSYPPLSAYRYAPYPLPPSAAAAAAAAAQQQHTQQQLQHQSTAAAGPSSATHAMVGQLPHPSQPSVFSSPSLAPYGAAPPGALAPPYQGYSLANVDMSSFQGIDWTNVYNVGMYA